MAYYYSADQLYIVLRNSVLIIVERTNVDSFRCDSDRNRVLRYGDVSVLRRDARVNVIRQ